MAFTLPRIPASLVSPDFQVWWQQVVEAIEAQENAQNVAIDAIEAAQAAADAANTAAAAANSAASSAQATADNITDANALGNSYVSGATITATDAGTDVTITISAHTRHYPQPDGTTVDVAVSGGTLTGRAYNTSYYVTYLDPTRAGGAVTYSTTTAEPAQIGDLHVVGEAPAIASGAPPADGGTVRPPGTGTISSI